MKLWEKIKEIWNADTQGVVGSMTPIGSSAESHSDHLQILRDGMPEVNRRVQEGWDVWSAVFSF